MEIFINSTFDQSMRGYRLMRLRKGGVFVDVQTVGEVGNVLYSFFSEELFRVIWCDIGDAASYFAVRGMQGVLSNGRHGFIDLAVLCRREELEQLSRVALGYLSNPELFAQLVFSATAVDGRGDYSFDSARFTEGLPPVGRIPVPVFNPEMKQFGNTDGVHLAVCIGSLERAFASLPQPSGKGRAKYVMETEKFDKLYRKMR